MKRKCLATAFAPLAALPAAAGVGEGVQVVVLPPLTVLSVYVTVVWVIVLVLVGVGNVLVTTDAPEVTMAVVV